ncbi:uncharacterized mitochondrial protein AtMg00810-like [Malus domestica]|uniref:uncharacterized mitochondrial protein AtMg00810-like n=1 Tax=Malus domestica TaxID=3750 RepID=UPI0007EE0A5D|nr:uncharacterized protein LOC108173547 [Malus domestica]
MDHLIKKLGSLFSMKDLGNLSYFLGIEVKYEGDSMHLCQSKYALDLLSGAKFIEAKPISTPVPSGQKLSVYVADPCVDPVLYRSVVKALQYLTITRPDLSYVVNQVCQFMHSPKNTHWMAVKRILRYLKATYDHGLLYKLGNARLTAFSDADYAGNPDTRHSTGGFYVYLDSNLVSWSSKKQKTDQLANIFTKGLSSSRFKFLVSKLPVVPPPVSLQGGLLDEVHMQFHLPCFEESIVI